MPLLTVNPKGLYCEAGDFYVDPWRPVDRAVITHAHADHARSGTASILAAAPSRRLLRRRLGDGPVIEPLPYGESITRNGVRVSLHPAGHLLGSAQVRLEHRGEVWVVSGDYKTAADPTCAPFEPVRCDCFISECTFGMPYYVWPDAAEVLADINRWWRENRDRGLTSVVLVYALGKAQRLLAGLDPAIGPILTHGAVETMNEEYRAEGVDLPPTQKATAESARTHRGQALVLAPPSVQGTTWLRRFQPVSSAFASGWMRVRGNRRRRAVDRGFILSDHADWPGLLEAIDATGASHVALTHGSTQVMARWLRESRRIDARALETEYRGEGEEDAPAAEGEAPAS